MGIALGIMCAVLSFRIEGSRPGNLIEGAGSLTALLLGVGARLIGAIFLMV
jgi:hypothetical protein